LIEDAIQHGHLFSSRKPQNFKSLFALFSAENGFNLPQDVRAGKEMVLKHGVLDIFGLNPENYPGGLFDLLDELHGRPMSQLTEKSREFLLRHKDAFCEVILAMPDDSPVKRSVLSKIVSPDRNLSFIRELMWSKRGIRKCRLGGGSLQKLQDAFLRLPAPLHVQNLDLDRPVVVPVPVPVPVVEALEAKGGEADAESETRPLLSAAGAQEVEGAFAFSGAGAGAGAGAGSSSSSDRLHWTRVDFEGALSSKSSARFMGDLEYWQAQGLESCSFLTESESSSLGSCQIWKFLIESASSRTPLEIKLPQFELILEMLCEQKISSDVAELLLQALKAYGLRLPAPTRGSFAVYSSGPALQTRELILNLEGALQQRLPESIDLEVAHG
jgi:hypothetical protein